jgi:hypothetical protein
MVIFVSMRCILTFLPPEVIDNQLTLKRPSQMKLILTFLLGAAFALLLLYVFHI